jgi:polysaccharide export outer membrane protein
MPSPILDRPDRQRRRLVRLALGTAPLLALGGCGALPRAGPLVQEVDAPGLEGLVIPLTAQVVARLDRPSDIGFPPEFLTAETIEPRRVGVDDLLEVLVWEPSGAGVFGAETGPSRLDAVRVERDGTIFLPFAGRIRAAGTTPASLRTRIKAALEPFTSAPEVDVRLGSGASRSLTIQGAVPKPGPYVIDTLNTRLAPMLALAGGASLDPSQVEVSIRRGTVTGTAMLEDIYDDPRLNVALRPGDLVVLTPLRERFLVLGASSIQAEITFPTRELDLLEALGAARGLRDLDANPTGIFVFRREDEALANSLLQAPPPVPLPPGPGRPVIYRLDLTVPGALFVAKAFPMRDGDAILATNAPFTEVRKILQVFSTAIVPISSAQNIF